MTRTQLNTLITDGIAARQYWIDPDPDPDPDPDVDDHAVENEPELHSLCMTHRFARYASVAVPYYQSLDLIKCQQFMYSGPFQALLVELFEKDIGWSRRGSCLYHIEDILIESNPLGHLLGDGVGFGYNVDDDNLFDILDFIYTRKATVSLSRRERRNQMKKIRRDMKSHLCQKFQNQQVHLYVQ